MRVDWSKSGLDHFKSHTVRVHDHPPACKMKAERAPKEFKFNALALHNLTSNIVNTLDFWLSNSSDCRVPANVTGPSVLANPADRAIYATRKSLLRRARGLTGKPRELMTELSKILASGRSKTVQLDPISLHIVPVNASDPVGNWMALIVPHCLELWGTTTYLCHDVRHDTPVSLRTHSCIAELKFEPLIPQLHQLVVGPNEYLDNRHKTSPWFVMLVESAMAVAIIVVTTMLLYLCIAAVLHLCRRDHQKRHKKRWLQGQATPSIGGYLKSQVLLVGFYIASQIAVDDVLDMYPHIKKIHSYFLIGCPSLIFGLAVHGTFRTYKLGLAHEECLDTNFQLLELPCRPLYQSVTGRLCLGLVLVACISFLAAVLHRLPEDKSEVAQLIKVGLIYFGLLFWCLWQLVKNRETRTRWNLLTLESISNDDEAPVHRRRTDHMVAGQQRQMPPATVFRPQRLLRRRALKELVARTVAVNMFSIGMFVCGTGSLDRLQKESALHDCVLSTGFMTMPFLHNAHVRTIYVDSSVKRLRIQCLPDSLTKAVYLTRVQYPLQQPIKDRFNVIPSAGMNPSFVVEVPLTSGPWPARLDLVTDGYSPQRYILYVLRVDTAVRLEMRATFNDGHGRGNVTFKEARRLDYQRSHSAWYLPRLSGTPGLHMKATSVVLAPLHSSTAPNIATGNVVVGESCPDCISDIPGFGSNCGFVLDNVSDAQGRPNCIFIQEPLEMLHSTPTSRLPSHERLVEFLQRSAGYGASLCVAFDAGGCTHLRKENQSQHMLSQYFETRLAGVEKVTSGLMLLGGKYDLSVDPLRHAVRVELIPYAPPPRVLARLSTDAGRDELLKDGIFITQRFVEKVLTYTLCYKEGTSFHNMLTSDTLADDERFAGSSFVAQEQTMSTDVCQPKSRHGKPAVEQYITMFRKRPCKSEWCYSYQQRSREFLADYRLIHEVMPTTSCAIAAIKYKDPNVSLWFRSCANSTSQGITPLMVASARGNSQAVELQLRGANANPNLQSQGWRETALHFAAKNGHVEVIKMLVQHRALLETPNRFGRTPLHAAIRSNSVEGVSGLLAAGTNVEQVVQKPSTRSEVPALLYAVYLQHVRIAEILLDFGADANGKGGRGKITSPLFASVMSGAKNSQRETKRMVELLLDHRADIHYQMPKQRDTVLHKACRRCLKDNVLQLLVDRSADVRARNARDMTPLETFTLFCSLEHKARLPLVKQILQVPADPADDSGMRTSRKQEAG